MELSIVVPVYNEEQNIEKLIDEITNSIKDINYEIVVVDDHSGDNTVSVLQKIQLENKRLRIIKHKKNYGQSFAVRTGVKSSVSSWIATLDGDGQNDPADIPELYLALIQQNSNNNNVLIAGHRVHRKDSRLKKISSKYANMIRSNILRDKTPDTGCGLKLFSKEFFLDLPSFNHMHRYIPALYISRGGRIVSLEVNHRPREKGESKYGFNNRFWVGIKDLMGVRWLQKRSKEIIFKEI